MVVFDKDYYRSRKYIAWRGPIVAKAIYNYLKPVSVIDVGCGTGDIVKGFLDLGVYAVGIDNAEHAGELLPEGHFINLDIINGVLWSAGVADLLLCIEFFGIIPKDKWLIATFNLKLMSRRILVAHNTDFHPEIDRLMLPYTPRPVELPELFPYRSKPAIKAIWYGARYYEGL